jgi:hypothetical protein
MKTNYSVKAKELLTKIEILEAFLEGQEIASNDSLRDVIYEMKKIPYEIKGFLYILTKN